MSGRQRPSSLPSSLPLKPSEKNTSDAEKKAFDIYIASTPLLNLSNVDNFFQTLHPDFRYKIRNSFDTWDARLYNSLIQMFNSYTLDLNINNLETFYTNIFNNYLNKMFVLDTKDTLRNKDLEKQDIRNLSLYLMIVKILFYRLNIHIYSVFGKIKQPSNTFINPARLENINFSGLPSGNVYIELYNKLLLGLNADLNQFIKSTISFTFTDSRITELYDKFISQKKIIEDADIVIFTKLGNNQFTSENFTQYSKYLVYFAIGIERDLYDFQYLLYQCQLSKLKTK